MSMLPFRTSFNPLKFPLEYFWVDSQNVSAYLRRPWDHCIKTNRRRCIRVFVRASIPSLRHEFTRGCGVYIYLRGLHAKRLKEAMVAVPARTFLPACEFRWVRRYRNAGLSRGAP